MRVKLELLSTSQALIFENVTNVYTKDGLLCIYVKEKNEVQKFPIKNIFRIIENYTV